MEKFKKEGMSLKEAATLTEKKKLTDLEYHKAKTLHGQFWSAENVDDYMKKEQDKTKKN